MSHKVKQKLLPCTLVAASTLFNTSAIAQAVEDAFELEVIEVTAQKRVQSKMDIPMSLSVLGAGQIENLDVQEFTDVTRVSPSLTMSQGTSPNGNVINMRGVGTSAFSIGAEPSVSVVVDDVNLIRTAQAFNTLEDIERIEVLRGPQGTLFGKNASAGVVSIITKAPGDEFSGRANLRATDDDEKRVSLSLTGPLSDTLGYRISSYYTDRDGFIKNLYNGEDLNGEKAWGVRAKLLWLPSDKLKSTLIVDKSYRESSTGVTWVDADPSVAGEGVTPGEDNLNVRFDSPNSFEAEQEMVVLKFDYDLPNHALSSITSYQSYDLDGVADVDLTDVPIPPSPFLDPLGIGGPNIVQFSDEHSDAISQEFRLTSTNNTGFEYMVGLFYQDAETSRDFNRYPLRFLISKWDATSTTESIALFGQGTLNLSEKTFLDIGLRLNREEISVEFIDYYGSGTLTEPVAVTSSGNDSQNAVTGKLALRHYLESGDLVFGSVSTGYKGQAYDIASGFSQYNADNPVGEETSVSFEVGVKGRSENRHLSYEFVAFRSEFNDYQAQGAVLDEMGAPTFALNNVGKLRTQGLEADLAYQATESLNLNASIAYVDATIESFEGAQCYSGQTVEEGCMIGAGPGGLDIQNLNGQDLNNSPDLKYSLGAYWEEAASGRSFNYFAQANYQWQDDVNYDLYGNPLSDQSAYGIANVSFGIIESQNQRYKLTFFVNNLFDQSYSLGYTDYSARLGGLTALGKQWTRGAMRFMGVNFSYSF